jgi:hypothetical protein
MLYDSNGFKPYIFFDLNILSMFHTHTHIYIYIYIYYWPYIKIRWISIFEQFPKFPELEAPCRAPRRWWRLGAIWRGAEEPGGLAVAALKVEGLVLAYGSSSGGVAAPRAQLHRRHALSGASTSPSAPGSSSRVFHYSRSHGHWHHQPASTPQLRLRSGEMLRNLVLQQVAQTCS